MKFLSGNLPQVSFRILVWIVLSVVFLAYLPVLQNHFVNWDDDVHLLNNTAVRSLSLGNLPHIATSLVNGVYIPLATLSFAVEYHFFGYAPFVYHLDNLLLHLLVTALAMLLARRLGLSGGESALAGLIFGLHPLHVESVAWVTERKDVLYAAFYLLAALAHLRYVDSRKAVWFISSLALGVLSMLAKPMAISLPLILLLLDWYQKRQDLGRAVFEKMYFLIFLVPVAWLTYALHMTPSQMGLGQTVLFAVWGFVFYLQKFFIPGNLTLFYAHPQPVDLAQPAYIVSLAVCALLFFFGIMFRRNRLFLLAAGFYAFSIFFLLRYNPVQESRLVADRFMYLPSLGICFFAAALIRQGWERVRKNKNTSGVYFLSLIMIFAGMGYQTFRQCLVWRDGVSLWSHQLKLNPAVGPALLYTQLGQARMEADEFNPVIRRLSLPSSAQENAQAFADRKALQEVEGLFDRAIEIRPDFVYPYYFKAKLRHSLGNHAQAVKFLRRAVELDPKHGASYLLLGKVFMDMGEPGESILSFRQTLAVLPQNRYAYQEILGFYSQAIARGDHPEIYRQERERTAQVLQLE